MERVLLDPQEWRRDPLRVLVASPATCTVWLLPMGGLRVRAIRGDCLLILEAPLFFSRVVVCRMEAILINSTHSNMPTCNSSST